MIRVRLKLGLTQKELADILGYNRNAIWRWEKGIHPIKRAVALAVAGLVRDHEAKKAE